MTGQGSGPGAEGRRLQQIISGMTDGVILADPDGAITWASGAALSMHGIGRVVELGRTIEAYRSRFKLRTCGGVEPGLDATERDVLVEVTPLRRRRPVWVHQVRTLVLTDEAGETDCQALILRDVTERVEAERRFEASFDVNPAPAVICRLHDRTVVKVNTGFLQLTGYAARQIVGRRFTEIDVLDGVGDADSVQARLLGGEPLGQTEARLRTAEGREKPVIIAGQPIELGEEKCTMFTFIDLQPRRAAEEALRESEARAKAYFEALYAQAPVALHSLDRDRRIVSVSDRWLELLGYTREEVVGRPIADFLPDREAGRAFARDWDTLLAEGVVHDLRHRFVKRSGAIVDVLVSARAVTLLDMTRISLRPTSRCT